MSGLVELAACAAAQGLVELAELLRRAEGTDAAEVFADFDTRVPVDPRLGSPAAQEPITILPQLVRRGLDPALVRELLAGLAEQPLEAGLVAWDTLNHALLPPGDPFVDELRRLARPLKSILPDPGRGGLELGTHPAAEVLPRWSGARAIERVSDVQLMAWALEQRLASFSELERRHDPLLRRPQSQDSLRSYARMLHYAHLPTLSSLYWDFLVRVLGDRSSVMELCEAYFDAGSPDRLPGDAIQRGDLPPAQLHDAAEYLVYRTWQALGDANKAYTLLEANLKSRARELPSPSARLVVVRAHLGTLFHQRPVSLERVDRLYEQDRLWRYGARARAVVAAAQSTHRAVEPLQILHDFVTAFGNDLGCWTESLAAARNNAGWKREAARLLARECLALPHEPAVWKPLAMFIGDAGQIRSVEREIDGQLLRQAGLLK